MSTNQRDLINADEAVVTAAECNDKHRHQLNTVLVIVGLACTAFGGIASLGWSAFASVERRLTDLEKTRERQEAQVKAIDEKFAMILSTLENLRMDVRDLRKDDTARNGG